ncbi:hypothetical protein MWN33_07610 [Starkeya koreensis]|uniref:Flagellar assembly protein FliH/Type III secretion system HrpE domain-containing protein n=1 Tax=Ancylobacter koreensis TaxID=266121 RepID=A0ABT0DKT6_9HYPH|nr:hypothetical protein [Ancylobacter koreensis]MCK0207898.1 hypothetical protein [Ancylobacter koreensis]
MHAMLRHLPDFSQSMPGKPGVPRPAAGTRDSAARREPASQPAPAPAARPEAPDPATIAAAAAETARAEAQAAAREAFERQRAQDREEQRAQAERDLAEARRLWAVQEGDVLAAAMADGLRRLEDDLSARLARILSPLLAVAVRERALSDMTTTIRDLLAAGDAPLLRVTGAPDLVEALRARIDPQAPVAFESASGADVALVAASTTVETRIGAWAERLGAAVG